MPNVPTLTDKLCRIIGHTRLPGVNRLLWKAGKFSRSVDTEFEIDFDGRRYRGNLGDFIDRHIYFTGLPRAHVVRSGPSASWEDMFLMARCRHNIIANSSYSWWGAWLNPAEGRRVIAPARWFTPGKLATCNVLDLYPDDWILLK